MDSLKKLNQDFLSSKKKIDTDSIASKLHYKLTIMLLVLFAISATSNQYFGKLIECTIGQKNVPRDLINTYCWIIYYRFKIFQA